MSEEQPQFTRRGLLQTGAAAGAAGAVGTGTLPAIQRTRAAAPLAYATYFTAGVVVTHGVNTVMGYFGDDTDEILEAEANELHDRIHADAIEIEADLQDHFDSVQNTITLLTQHIRTNYAFTIANEAELGSTKTETIEAAKQEVEDTIAEFQTRTIHHYERHHAKLGRRSDLVDDAESFSDGNVFEILTPDGDYSDGVGTNTWDDYATLDDYSTNDYELVNGDLYSYPSRSNSTEGYRLNMRFDFTDTSDYTLIDVSPRDSGQRHTIMDMHGYANSLADFEALVADEKQNAEMLVESTWDGLQDGTIDAHDLASGKAILDAAEDPEHFGEAAGVYRAIAMPEAEAPVVLDFPGVRFEGIPFWTHPSDGGLPVSEAIIPENEIGQIYLAGEITDVGEHVAPHLIDDLPTTEVEVYVHYEGDVEQEMEGATVHTDLGTYETDPYGYVESAEIFDTDSAIVVEYNNKSTEKVVNPAVSTEYVVEHDGHTLADSQVEQLFDISEDNIGDVVNMRLSQPFEIVGVHNQSGATTLQFEDRKLIEPDQNDHEDLLDALGEASEKEADTREERIELIVDIVDGDGAGIGWPSVPGTDSIGRIVTAAIGFGVFIVVFMIIGAIQALGYETDLEEYRRD